MTRQELFDFLDENLLENRQPISTVVYAVMKDTKDIKKLDISNDAISDVQNLYLNSIKEKIREKEELNVLLISQADDRANILFEYDLDLPESLSFFSTSLGDRIPLFNFQRDQLTDIDYLLIEIGDGDNIVKLLKRLTSVEVFGRGGNMIWKQENRFERFEEKVLRLSPNFHGIYLDNHYFFLDINMLERSHGFNEVLSKEATNSLSLISDLDLLESTQGLVDLLGNTSFARKVVRVKNSPVIVRRIPNERIIEFTRNHPALVNKMRYSEDGTKLILHTKVAKELFIKMLDDAYLTSELTEQNYESKAKDVVELEVNDIVE